MELSEPPKVVTRSVDVDDTMKRMTLLPIQHPAAGALAIFSFLPIGVAVLLLRVRYDSAGGIYKKHFGDNRPRERLLYSSLGFYLWEREGRCGIDAVLRFSSLLGNRNFRRPLPA
jgi:hypothetical protein